jgi:hypothetical protein
MSEQMNSIWQDSSGPISWRRSTAEPAERGEIADIGEMRARQRGAIARRRPGSKTEIKKAIYRMCISSK